MSSEIKVDTISENTSANGVAIDSVTLKDGIMTGAVSDGTATKSKIMGNRWKLNANYSASTGSELLNATFDQTELVGSAMTVSSGTFTFPYVGKFYINYHIHGASSSAAAYRGGEIKFTTDDSSYSNVSSGYTSTTANTYWNMSLQSVVDVTNTSNCKVRFHVENAGSCTVSNQTNVFFYYLGDT